MQHLVKQKGLPNIDATWMTKDNIKQHDTSEKLISSGNLSLKSHGKYGVGAPSKNEES